MYNAEGLIPTPRVCCSRRTPPWWPPPQPAAARPPSRPIAANDNSLSRNTQRYDGLFFDAASNIIGLSTGKVRSIWPSADAQ